MLYPVQTNVVSLQPVFRWTADSPRGPFDFELKSVGATAKTIYKAKAGDTMVKLPSSVKLQLESEYAWTVKMPDKVADKLAGKKIGSGSFKPLPVASRELVQQRKPADKAEFSDWLLYGLTLRELGATQDAAEVFGKLARE